MSKKLEIFKKYILEIEQIPESNKLFGGSNLIISDNPNRSKKKHDILVITNNPKEISWFIFQLKDIYVNNERHIYRLIGDLLIEAISNKIKLKDQLVYVIDKIINSSYNS